MVQGLGQARPPRRETRGRPNDPSHADRGQLTESQLLPGLVPNGDSASLSDASSTRELVGALADCQPAAAVAVVAAARRGFAEVLCFARREFFGSTRSSLAR